MRKLLLLPAFAAALAAAGCGATTPTPKPVKVSQTARNQAAALPDAPSVQPSDAAPRHARSLRRYLKGAGFGPPVTHVELEGTDVYVGTIGDPVAVCNQVANGYAASWMTHVQVNSAAKGDASWMPGQAACS